MTNPSNTVRVRARAGGRASVYEANAWAQAFSAGLLEGDGVKQNTSANMNVLVGGSSAKPDVVIAENPSGYKIALDLVSQVTLTITKPASNSRISAIVAYTDDLAVQSTETTVTGSPSSCGLIVVNGNAAAAPVPPSDATIRSAITADGATGSQACYVVVATILVSSNTTAITDSLIGIKKSHLAGEVVKDENVDWGSFLAKIVATGSINLGNIAPYSDVSRVVDLPTQINNYRVLVSRSSANGYWANVAITTTQQSRNNFTILAHNNGEYMATDLWCQYVVFSITQ